MKILKKIAAVFTVFIIMMSIVPAASAESDYYIYIPYANVNLRSGPGAEYAKKGRSGAALSLEYLGAQFDSVDILWFKVRDSSGFTGWVSSNYSRRYFKRSAKPKYGKIICETDGTLYSDVSEFIYDTSYDANAIGVQVAAIRGSDGKIFDWTYGYSKWGKKAVGTGTKFRAASISKVAVAICALKMQEQGIVDLNRKIDKYWGAKLPKAISLTALLTHTSTLQYLSLKIGRDDLLAQLLDPTHYNEGKVGSRKVWGYNNYASSVAAATLELAADTSLEDYAQENIFAPLGVDMSFFAGRVQNTSKLATLYEEDHGVELTVSEAKCLLPDEGLAVNCGNYIGGLTGSAREVAKMFYMLANDGRYGNEQILAPESVEALEKKYLTAQEYGGTFKQGLTVRYMSGLYGTEGVYYHTGNAYGVISLASYDPVTKDVVVVFTTGASHKRDDNGIYKICSDISRAVFVNLADL